jgi:hypothetical protein
VRSTFMSSSDPKRLKLTTPAVAQPAAWFTQLSDSQQHGLHS